MGTVDIEEYTDEICDSGSVYWDTDKYTYEQYRSIITECVRKEVEWDYKQNDGEIDDWDYFEYRVRTACDKALGNED